MHSSFPTLSERPAMRADSSTGGLGPADGLTLETVLDNQATSPFSLREFADYLEQTYCSENLAFYMAVTDYRESARLYFGSSPETLSAPATVPTDDGATTAFWFRRDQQPMLNHELQVRFRALRAKFQDILERFILSNAPQEVNIPYELRHQLLQTHRDQHSFHPALLKPPCVAVVELMRISAFIPFATDPDRLAAAAAAAASAPKPSRSSKSTTTMTPTPRSPVPHVSSSMSLSPPPVSAWTPDFDAISLQSTSTTTSASSHNPSTILRKLTNTLRLRARSQSPPRQTSWKQITIPDPQAFLHAAAAAPPSLPSSSCSATAPAMERGLSNSSVTSTASTASSHRGSSTSSTAATTRSAAPSHHHHPYQHHLDTPSYVADPRNHPSSSTPPASFQPTSSYFYC